MSAARYIDEVEHLRTGSLRHLAGRYDPAWSPSIDGLDVLCTGTGRSALRLVLEHLASTGVLANRNVRALVPEWMCQSVLYTMHRFCHPVTRAIDSVAVVLAYHQYGFPQDMDAVGARCQEIGAVLIEDCAHALDSQYRGRRVGTFGLAAVYSFSKLFPSVLGGAMATADADLLSYARGRMAASRFSGTTYSARILWEMARDTRLERVASAVQEMAYALTDQAFRMRPVSLRVLQREGVERAMGKRRENYRFLLEQLGDRPEYFEGLERVGVTPYVVPLFDSEERLAQIVARMHDAGFRTGVYNFDVARNLFEPRFRKCVWLPVHQGLSQGQLERVCEIVLGT